MFSFNPLPIIDTLNDHTGFWWIMAFMVLYVVYNTLTAIEYGDKSSFFGGLLFAGAIIALSAFISWNTGSITTPKNEKVIGNMVGYTAEGEAYTQTSGKTTVRRENHYLYVVYKIDGYGNIPFRAEPGNPYPTNAIIYKN